MARAYLIFDCDGVLVDSEPLSMKIDVEILAENGVVLSEGEAHERFVGKTFAAMIDEVERQFGVRFPGDASAQKDRRLLRLYETQLRVVDGVEEALRRIGLAPYSVASNSPAERVAASLRITGLTPYFGARITTYEHVPRPKPAPDVFREAARRAGFQPADCIVIEDSVTGVTSAHAAGCAVLGFTGTHPNVDEHARKLQAAGARATFHGMERLPGLVRAILDGR